ncbi:HNH/ENDO VII family nuclease, partial [Ursidibacter maritimus]|uniref:HNH/ENDO VII family nuclease n=2 Tax=Ursidibacter maritimus TaxID=1331689 RepID=UPI001C492EE8
DISGDLDSGDLRPFPKVELPDTDDISGDLDSGDLRPFPKVELPDTDDISGDLDSGDLHPFPKVELLDTDDISGDLDSGDLHPFPKVELPDTDDISGDLDSGDLHPFPKVELPDTDDISGDLNGGDLYPSPQVEPLDIAEDDPRICYIAPTNMDSEKLLESLENRDLTPITDETKERLRENGWPEEIIENLTSEEEVEIYEKAGLKPMEINGKWCLVRTDIDYDQKDELGRTNLERMEQGLAPLDKNGKPIELHHVGQSSDAPLAQLTQKEHRGDGNDAILHDKAIESEIARPNFNQERKEHWKAMAEAVKEQQANNDV